jgi:hypothetical protein
LSCLGTVVFNGRQVVGAIDVSFGGGSVLLGMTFLKNAGMSLFIDPKSGMAKIEESTIIPELPPTGSQ